MGVLGQAVADQLAVALLGCQAALGKRTNMVRHQLEREIQQGRGVAHAQFTGCREHKRDSQPRRIGQGRETPRCPHQLSLGRLRRPNVGCVVVRQAQIAHSHDGAIITWPPVRRNAALNSDVTVPRYFESVSTNAPGHEPLFPPRPPQEPGFDERPIHPQGSLRMWARRVFGPIAAALVLGFQWLLKLKFLFFALAKFSFVTTALTMVVSVGAYTLLWGWPFAALFVLLLFVHELGHALWLRKEGIPAGMPVFIPFLGAVIGMKGMPRDAYVEAKVGLAGPVLGTLGAAVVLGLGEYTNSDLLRAAGHTGFLLNLFNLLPIVPLDGGRAMAAIHPALWIAGIAGLAALLIVAPNALLILILFFAAREAWSRYRSRGEAAAASYYTVAASRRVLIAVVYVGVAAVCVLGMRAGYVNT
jgi:Zn-dependent protease